MPSNSIIVYNEKTDSFDIKSNYLGLKTGISALPVGFELRKNIWGFTVIVPKDSEGLYLKRKPSANLNNDTAAKPPKIGILRLALGMLNNDQINQVNKDGKLPCNAKIVYNKKTNSYDLTTNYFGITTGTSTLPAGYELRKNIWGFTVVVPTNSEGLYLRRKSSQMSNIGFLRLHFGRLNNDQINQVNKGGKLPSNAIIVYNEKTDSFDIKSNYLGLKTGISALPTGFELRKNIWGFTVIVPKDSEGLYLRRKTSE